MPCIAIDPSQEECPPYETQQWDYLRQVIIDAHQGPQPLTPEEAIQRLKDAWTWDHDTRMAAWNAQREQERAEMEEQEQLAQEEQEARRAQHEREVEEQRKEAEKKKPKLNSFDPNRSVGRWIKPRPAQYALNKINALDYVELDYFTTRGCDEAAADANQSLSQDTFGFAQVDGAFTIRPLAAQKASKNIRRDEDLSWEEMLQAKNNMLQFMSDSKVWPKDHAETLTGFFVSLELHPRAQYPNGRQALLLYQSRVRREWFSALKRDEGFNIEIIEEELLRSYAETVDNQIRDRQIDERVHKAMLAFESSTPRSTSRKNRERGRQKFNRLRSASPTRAGSSRGSHRSCSPPTKGESPPRRHTESRTRDHGGRFRKDRGEFFRSSADSRGEVCAACLGRHEHTFAKCDGHRL